MSASCSPIPADPAFAARMAALHRNFPLSLLGVLFTVALVIVALHGAVPHAQLAAWAVANVLLTSGRAWHVRRYRQAMQAQDATALHRWRREAIVGAVAGGLLWGLPPAYWMLQVPLPQQMCIVAAMLIMGTSAIYAYCVDSCLLYAFQVPYVLPAILAMATIDDVLLRVMSVAGALYLLVTLSFAHRIRTQADALQSRFENLHLPGRFAMPPANEPPAVAIHVRPAPLRFGSGGRLVLVDDDDAESRRGLQLLLESWGYSVVATQGGAQLLNEVTQRPGKPALVISDDRLREGETGVDVIDRVHEEYNDDGIPALLVSGDTNPQRISEVAARGWQMLHKPVPPALLRAALTRLLANEG
ncbi:response regulator [Variovorax sp. GB1P17]|uniref:response regulator n=1 Tax=Variovorax sp. GB1P17 TaxID=3443740 RepID=UPI003F448327